jgi:hypothetical protein
VLSEIAAESLGLSPKDITRLVKIAEGGSYRVFEVSFKNKVAVIIRLPYPCTVPRNYGVVSEVATTEYLRLHGVPIPRILAWSSTTSNRLGCEYIIMEKARGKELQEVWYTMAMRRGSL